MSKTATGLVLAGVVFCVVGRALADAASDYQALFGEQEKTVAKQDARAAFAFANKLLAAARSTSDQKDLQAILCGKAYEFGMKSPAGYPMALGAMRLLLATDPQDRRAVQEKLLNAAQLSYAKSAGEEHQRLGQETVDFLLTFGDERAAAKQLSEAMTLYRKAQSIATAERSPRVGEIMDKIKKISAAQESERKLKDLKARQEAAPKNSALRMELIVAYLGEFDDPEEAAKLVNQDLDEKVRTNVPLAAGKAEDLDEAACLELARWYVDIAKKASPAGTGVLLGKAKGCCERYLALHTAQDATRLKGQMLLDEVEKAIEKAGPRLPKTLTLDLGRRVRMKLVLIPAGKFTMGSPGDEQNRGTNEGPQRKVTLSKSFYMGAYEVTQEQYQQVMGKNPSNFKGAQYPVGQVSWNDAVEFCRKLSQATGKTVSLPTEAQWEYACRAGSKTRFSYGNDNEYSMLGNYAWHSRNSDDKPHPVGLKKPNAWGLYDMYGNVWEWCSDWYADSYASAKKTDPTGPASGELRILRGGSCRHKPQDCRTAIRYRSDPGARIIYGFRVVVSIPK